MKKMSRYVALKVQSCELYNNNINDHFNTNNKH